MNARLNKILIESLHMAESPGAKAWLNDGHAAKEWHKTIKALLERAIEQNEKRGLGLSDDQIDEAVAVEVVLYALNALIDSAKSELTKTNKRKMSATTVDRDAKKNAIEASRWSRVRTRTPEERSKSAKRAAETRRARQQPVDVKVNNVPIAGAYFPVYQDRVAKDMVYFTSKRALRRLADLPMVQKELYSDDYYGDYLNDYGKGKMSTLGELLAKTSTGTRVYLNLYNGVWVLKVSFYTYNTWASAEPISVLLREPDPTTEPEGEENPMMPRRMTASVRKQISDSLLTAADELERRASARKKVSIA